MIGNSAKIFIVFTLVGVASVFSFSILLQNASGDFLEILKMGKAGVKVLALAFIPMGGYLVYKAAV